MAIGLVARRGVTAARRRIVPLLAETFQSYPLATPWAQGATVGGWLVRWTGDGQVVPVDVAGDRVLQLESSANPNPDVWGDTASTLVTSVAASSGDLRLTARMRTVAQLRTEASPSRGAPNPWEVAWIGWNHSNPAGAQQRFYYVTLKPNGFELGKVDQTIALPGGQRFLWTADGTTFPIGAWNAVEVRQTGARIQVWVNGAQLADFTDGPGSAGTPAWGATSGETVLTSGAVALYHEDARAQFDNVTLENAVGLGLSPLGISPLGSVPVGSGLGLSALGISPLGS